MTSTTTSDYQSLQHRITALSILLSLAIIITTLTVHIPHDATNFHPIAHNIVDTVLYIIAPIAFALHIAIILHYGIHHQDDITLVVHYTVSTALSTLSLHLLFILCGASLYTHVSETLTLALIITLLNTPNIALSLYHYDYRTLIHSIHTLQFSAHDRHVLQHTCPYAVSLLITLLCSYIACYSLALDWELQWQIYPVPNLLLSAVGYSMTSCVMHIQHMVKQA
jgi:hypothetical protein